MESTICLTVLLILAQFVSTEPAGGKHVTDPLVHASSNYIPSANGSTVGYVTAAYWGSCSGLGNLLYVYASLRGIADDLNRTAYLVPNDCFLNYVEELREIYPNFAKEVLLMEPNESLVYTATFSDVIPGWDNPARLRGLANHKFLRLSGGHLQNSRFFHYNDAVRKDILRVFECGKGVVEKMGAVRRSLGSGDQYAVCIHNRRGDFLNFGWQSQPDFIRGAVPAVVDYLGAKATTNSSMISLLLFGDDQQFNADLIPTLPFEPKSSIHLFPENISRGETLCFAAHYCDSVVMTSHVTTYGYWMGYFMRERERLVKSRANMTKEVFYNSELNDREQSPLHRRRISPGDWVGLDWHDGKVVVVCG